MGTDPFPRYLDLGGQIVHPQPIAVEGMRLFGFLFESPRPTGPGAPVNRLQSLCNQALNTHPDRRYDYHAISSHFLLTFSDSRKLSSADGIGYVSELCATFWVVTLAVRRAPLPLPERLALYIPYIFVDNQYSLIGAREVYGLRKSLGEFRIPEDFSNAELFTTSTLAFKTFSPETQAQMQQLVTVRRIDDRGETGPLHGWGDHHEFFVSLMRAMLGREGQLALHGIEEAIDVLDFKPKISVPLVGVKQFRDAALSQQACYQALVEAPVRPTSLPEVGLLPGEYRLSVDHADSHPIDADLGVPPEGLTAQLAFWAEMDFVIEAGRVVQSWRPAGDGGGCSPFGRLFKRSG